MQVLLPETILGTDGVVTTLSIGSPKMHSKKKSIGLSIPITEVKKSTRKFLQSQKSMEMLSEMSSYRLNNSK